MALGRKPLTPGSLAADLANAKAKRDEQVRAAEAAFSNTRANVIEQGTTRIEQIQALRAELDAEENDLHKVVSSA